jgi:hypothetical protein
LSPFRAREAPTEPQLPPRRRRPLSLIPFSRIPDAGPGRTLEPPLVRSALVTAPVALSEVRGRRRHDGPNGSRQGVSR